MSIDKSVLLVGINYAPEPTGISPYTTGVARGLARRGWQIRVLTTYPHYPWWRIPDEYRGLPTSSNDEGVLLTRLRLQIPDGRSALRRAIFEIRFGLRATFRRWHKPEVVIVVTPALLASRIVALRARLFRTPVVTWVQDIYTLGITETGGSSVAARVIRGIERNLGQVSRRVIVIHDRFRNALRSRLGVRRPIEVVRNWSHVGEVNPAQRDATRRSLGWSDRDIVVLHAGNMGQKQGLENVVRASELAASTGSRVKFVLLGDGNQRAKLEAMSQNSALSFIDPLPDDQFMATLVAADILLVNELPGLTEMSVPSKLTTYFATGLPVLASVDPGSTTHDEVTAANAGICVSAGEPDALVRAAESIADAPEQAAVYGESARAYRRRVLTETAAIDAFERVLRSL